MVERIVIPEGSTLTAGDYEDFLQVAYALFKRYPQYLALDESARSLELAHLIPEVPETILAIYVGINDAVCNKALVTPFLPNHAHNNVFVFDPETYSGSDNVPSGTIDAREILNGFQPPKHWLAEWTYVMIEDPHLPASKLWGEKGYIDTIPAKLEDFTMLSDIAESMACAFIDPKAFDHPVNAGREYLKKARERGDKMVGEFTIPEKLRGEFDALAPVILNRGEKLYVANGDFSPCAHGWTNIHPANKEYAVINENSAVPLDTVITKPPVNPRYAAILKAPRGSADMTTDWFLRGKKVFRKALLQGQIKG